MFISSKSELSSASDAGFDSSRHIVDFSEFETDFTSPFHRTSTHKNRWLLTTAVAGVVGALVVGGTLIGTFGLGSVQRPNLTAQVIQTAEILQEPSTDIRRERLLGVLGIARIVGRSELAETIVSDPVQRVAVAKTEGARIPQDGQSIISSAGPQYQSGGTTEIGKRVNGSDRIRVTTRNTTTKPQVLATPGANQNDPLRIAALTPARIGNQATIAGAPATPGEEEIIISRGQTLMGILTQRGANREEARRMIAALEPVYPTRLLRDGQKIKLAYLQGKDEFGLQVIRPTSLSFESDANRSVLVSLEDNGDYVGTYSGAGRAVAALPDGGGVDAKQRRITGTIDKNFYLSAKNQGIPKPIIARMMRVHAFDVDFQREVREGDKFEVFYGEPLSKTKAGGKKRDVLLFSALTLRGKTKGYFRFTTPDDGITGFYDENGRSATTLLMRTPVTGARISSTFGMRKHPILGYSRLHAGVDFAAPRGTPIKAAGNGKIERAGRNGSYGIYMRIKHANGYKTAYAHMRRLAKGMKPGKRVRQGQVIGYVGSTGRSTGPHLHYEVHRNGKKTNPMKVKVANGRKLTGKMLKQFQRRKNIIQAMMRGAPTSTRVASADDASVQ